MNLGSISIQRKGYWSLLLTGYDPTSLSIEMPENEFTEALAASGEGIVYSI